MNEILDYYAQINSPYLHAKGENATEYLIEWLDCQKGERILEFGIGTGATLIKVASRYKNTIFFGLDSSELMIKKSFRRLKFCRLASKVVLNKIIDNKFEHIESDYFDKIYIESVLGIQNGETLEKLLSAFKRILKPSGKLILNETIWLNSTDSTTINEFNQFAVENFGIIQANAEYPYLLDWKVLLTSNGFVIQDLVRVDELKHLKIRSTYNEKLSTAFTIFGKIYGKLRLKHVHKKFKEASKKIRPDRQIMTGYLIMTVNEKHT